jgi:hypothetical protein
MRHLPDARGKFFNHQRRPGDRRRMNVARRPAFLFRIALFGFCRFRILDLIGFVGIAGRLGGIDVQQFSR